MNAQGPVYRINDTRELYFIPRDGVHDYINISLHSICGVRGIIYNCNYIIAHYHTCMHVLSKMLSYICGYRLSIHATTTHNIPLSATMVTNTTNKLSISAQHKPRICTLYLCIHVFKPKKNELLGCSCIIKVDAQWY